jgi:hypothetical protein
LNLQRRITDDGTLEEDLSSLGDLKGLLDVPSEHSKPHIEVDRVAWANLRRMRLNGFDSEHGSLRRAIVVPLGCCCSILGSRLYSVTNDAARETPKKTAYERPSNIPENEPSGQHAGGSSDTDAKRGLRMCLSLLLNRCAAQRATDDQECAQQ